MKLHYYTIWLTLSLMALMSTSSQSQLYTYSGNWQDTPPDFYPLDGTTWMSKLPDDSQVKDIYIPGTHETGSTAYGVMSGTYLGRCQTLPITKQLEAGVRFLDLRVAFSGSNAYIYHGWFNQGILFNDVWKDMTIFLSTYPDNFILVRLRLEETNVNRTNNKLSSLFFQYAVNNLLSVYTDNLCATAQVGALRGKILLFKSNWKNDNNWVFQYGDETDCLHIQDEYDVRTYAQKQPYITQFQPNPSKININYFSFSFSLYVTGLASPEYHAQETNPLIEQSQNFTSPQIMVFDFITGYISSKVYNKNRFCDAPRNTPQRSWSKQWEFNKAGGNDNIVVTFFGSAQIKCVGSGSQIPNYGPNYGSLINTLFQSDTVSYISGCKCYVADISGSIDIAINTAQKNYLTLAVDKSSYACVNADGVVAGATFTISNPSPRWVKNYKNFDYALETKTRDWGGIGDDFTYVGNHGVKSNNMNNGLQFGYRYGEDPG